MNDFLYSSVPGRGAKLKSALLRYRPCETKRVCIWDGSWGTLVVVGSAYPGFDAVETERHIIVVLGGPMPRKDTSVARGKSPDDGTRYILQHWEGGREIAWDVDLVGHFLVCCIEKSGGSVEIITDINSFVPVYFHRSDVAIYAGSHADALAKGASCAHDIDCVSIADFIANKTVTAPYTMYKKIVQGAAASRTRIVAGEETNETYWRPIEAGMSIRFPAAAHALRNAFCSVVDRICCGTGLMTVFLSGGEDSRALITVVSDSTQCRAVTFSDKTNRESLIAERVAKKNAVSWEMFGRKESHYIDHIDSSLLLCESHNSFLHSHSVGIDLHSTFGERVVGALGADGLFKGSRVKGVKRAGILWRRDVNPSVDTINSIVFKDENAQKLVDAFEKRRKLAAEEMVRLRGSSAAEWRCLVPATMYTDFASLTINRRQYPSYEPYCDAVMFKLAAQLPQEWKVNRRLYHLAMKPLFKRTWNIPHGDGWYPYWGIWVNAPLLIMGNSVGKARTWLETKGMIQCAGNQGPWPLWERVVRTPEFAARMNASREIAVATFPEEFASELKWLLQPLNCFNVIQQLSLLQVFVWMSDLRIDIGEAEDSSCESSP